MQPCNFGSTRTTFNSPWGRVHRGSYGFYWGNVKPSEDPSSYYLIIDTEYKNYKTDLANYERMVILMDDPWRRSYNPGYFVNPPKEVIQVWYGLAAPPLDWCPSERKVLGGHFWGANPDRKVSPRAYGSKHDVLLLGARKTARKKRLRHLLSNTDTLCVGGDWSDILPGQTYRHVVFGSLGAHKVKPEDRVTDVRQVAVEESAKCKVEIITHDPNIKSFMSIRLPDILCRGACPMVDLDHDPDRLLLISPKLRDNLYVQTETDVKRAVDFSLSVTTEDLQQEYDLQVQRAFSDMADLRKNLREQVYYP